MLPREASGPGRTAVIALRALAAALAAALTLAAGACGDEEDGGSTDAPGTAETALTVTLDPDGPEGKEPESSEEVTCGEATDDAACQALDGVDVAALEPVSPNTACTEIYGGPDTASLAGTIEGEEIDVELTRSNGCEIERFDAALPLLEALFPDYVPGSSLQP